MQKKPIILRVAVPCPLRRSFDYLAPSNWQIEQLKPGIRLQVPFGKRNMIGVLIATANQSALPRAQLKFASTILDIEPLLPKTILELCLKTADYYHHPIGDTLAHALPSLLRQGHAATLAAPAWLTLTTEGREAMQGLTRAPKQKQALALLQQHSLAVSQLREAGTTREVIQSLLKKDWISFCEPPIIPQIKTASSLALNNAQTNAVNRISQALGEFQAFLLHGVTGSGKTEVYLRIIQQVLASGKQALVLVPEIGLTPQTLSRFQALAPQRIALTHSGLNDSERLTAWLKAKQQQIDIVIGTRSAVFMPLQQPGIIIVDEEHDISYKQQEGLRYSARDLALLRGKLENIPVVLGSATPALESLHNTLTGRYHLLELPERAGSAIHPSFHILDLRNQFLQEGLSPALLKAIEQHIQAQGQVLLFLNRRGYAPNLLCHACGWVPRCQRCDANLTLHQHPPHLLCHHCNSNQRVPSHCAQCNASKLLPIGMGTQRLESFLKQQLPKVNIIRIDKDSTRRKGHLQTILQDIQDNTHQIMIGTQMLAKGHHFPNVTLVAILDADSGLFSTDFRTLERLAQMLIQVAGRAGRAERSGQVLIQTHAPEHPLLAKLIKEGYQGFANAALQERSKAQLPPYSYLALLRAEATKAEPTFAFLQQCADWAKSSKTVQAFGPVPAPMERRAGRYRVQLLLQAERREQLHGLLNQLLLKISSSKLTSKVRWSLDVDPLEMF